MFCTYFACGSEAVQCCGVEVCGLGQRAGPFQDRQQIPAVRLVDELGHLLQVLSGVQNHRLGVVQVQRSQGERQEVQPVHSWSQQLQNRKRPHSALRFPWASAAGRHGNQTCNADPDCSAIWACCRAKIIPAEAEPKRSEKHKWEGFLPFPTSRRQQSWTQFRQGRAAGFWGEVVT